MQGTGVTVGECLENDIASHDCAYNATTGDQISISLTDIIETISQLMQAWQVNDPMGPYMKAPEITSSKGKDVVTVGEDGTILWNLWLDTPTESGSSPKTYTYKLSYQVELNTAKEGFREDTFYETNLPTSLKYAVNLLNDDGTLNVNADIRVAYFNIPTVQGHIPEYPYRVEYYKQEDATAGDYENYTLVSRDTYEGPDTDLHSTVTLSSADPNYQTKYDQDHYSLAKADASIKITANEADNVLKVYYDRDTTSVTVNHYYKLITIDENGVSDEDTVDYGSPYPVSNEGLYVGESFTAQLREDVDGYHYDLVTEDSDPQTITLQDTNAPIDLYYVCTVDRRAQAEILEQYILITESWTLNDEGKYELTEQQSQPSEVYNSEDDPNADWRAFDEYSGTVDNADVTSQGYTFDHADATNGIVSGTQAKTILAGGDNTLTLYYRKSAEDTRVPTTVTIRHYYTMDRTYIENGEVKHETYTDRENTAVMDTVSNVYVGESFTAGESYYELTYDGFPFTLDPSSVCTLDALSADADENVINLYYTYSGSVTPETTTISVIHEYYEATRIYDEETESVTVEYAINHDLTETIDYPKTGDALYSELYVGQSFTAPLNPKAGFHFDASESDNRTVAALAASNGTITLRYYEDDPEEGRDDASIQFRHTYKTNWTVANPNGLGTTTRTDLDASSIVRDEELDNYEGYQGDVVSPTLNTTYNEKDYALTSDNDGEVTLTQIGDNGTINLVYERDDTDLTETDYTVTHHYMLRDMSIDENGKAVWNSYQEIGSSDAFTINGGNALPAELYAGNTFTVDTNNVYAYDLNGDGTAEDLTFTLRNAPNLTVKLEEEPGHLDIYYYYDDELPTATVRVRHQYTENKFLYSPAGLEFQQTNVTYNPSETGWISYSQYYVGETAAINLETLGYTFVSASNGTLNDEGQIELTVAAGNNDVVLAYSKDVDRRDSASVTVTHIYIDRDYDGSTTEVSRSSSTISFFAGMPFTVSYNTKSGLYPVNQITVSASGTYQETVMQDAVTLQNVESGDGNYITITYVRDVDTREATSVQVTHNYYGRDTYTDDDAMSDVDYIAQDGVAPEYSLIEVINSKEAGVWVGSSYTATQKPNYTVGEDDDAVVISYTFLNASPDGGKVDPVLALENGTTPNGNKIVLNYIRKFTSDPGDTTYTVVHEYYTNNTLSGSTSSTETAKVGSVINAADLSKVTSYGGNTYTYSSASPISITLTGTGSNTITLRYDRTTGGGGGGTTYYSVTVNYLDEDGNQIARSHSESLSSGSRYDVSAYDAIAIEGYVYDRTTGDALTGTMNGDKVINVYYTAEETEIDDPDTPTGELPDDPGTDVPSTDIPDEDVPQGELPEIPGTDIPDENVPGAEVPATGDTLAAWIAAAAVSGAGLVWLALTGKKRKEEDL